jgi:hypothetical protein
MSTRILSVVVFLAIPALAADRAESPAVPVITPAAIAPVLRVSEPTESRFVTLPGPPAPPPRELKEFTPPPPPPLPAAQLPANPPVATLAIARPKLPALPDERPILRRAPKPVLPPDFERDTAAYCQQRIGEWSEPDAYNLFGKALRRRAAPGDSRADNGFIFAFSDPTGKYREIELDFAAETGILRSVFVYPWQMTWDDARQQWGEQVTAAKANKGRMFYSYVNRRLDVLVDPDGRIVSLGLY